MNNHNKGLTRLILVRHGRTRANEDFLIQGASDGLLTVHGEAQAEQIGFHLSRFKIDHIISSDLTRAYATAMAIAKHHNLPVEKYPLIREWNVGLWDGLRAEEFLNMLKATGKPVSEFSPEGGETLHEVRERARKFLSIVLEKHCEQTVVVCSHGDLMRMLVGNILGIEIDQANKIHFNNASYSLFEYNGQHWRAMAINRLPDPAWELD